MLVRVRVLGAGRIAQVFITRLVLGALGRRLDASIDVRLCLEQVLCIGCRLV